MKREVRKGSNVISAKKRSPALHRETAFFMEIVLPHYCVGDVASSGISRVGGERRS